MCLEYFGRCFFITISTIQSRDAYLFWALAPIEVIHIAGMSFLVTSLALMFTYANWIPQDVFKEMLAAEYAEHDIEQKDPSASISSNCVIDSPT